MAEEEKVKNSMYIGPSIPIIGLRGKMIILGSEPPPQLKSLIQTKPVIGSLFVPTSKVFEAAERVKIKGTLENIAAGEVRKFNSERREREKKVSKPEERKL
jgi:hypothetical protein